MTTGRKKCGLGCYRWSVAYGHSTGYCGTRAVRVAIYDIGSTEKNPSVAKKRNCVSSCHSQNSSSSSHVQGASLILRFSSHFFALHRRNSFHFISCAILDGRGSPTPASAGGRYNYILRSLIQHDSYAGHNIYSQ
jgi:hypothetical protein